MTYDNKPRKISFEYNGISVNIEVANPSFLKFYESNPERVRKILLASFCDAVGDVYSGEEFDSVLRGINVRAREEKSLLLRTLIQEEKALKN